MRTEIWLSPAIAAVLAVVGFLVRAWWERRSAEHRVKRDLGQAKDEVAFIEAWIKAAEQTDPPSLPASRAQAMGDLHRAYQLAQHSAALARSHPEPITARQVVRWITFRPPPRSWPAKVIRWVGYPLILISFWAWATVGVEETVGTSRRLSDVVIGVFLLAVGILPVWGMRFAIRRLDTWLVTRKQRPSRSPPGPPPMHPLGQSRPTGPVQP